MKIVVSVGDMKIGDREGDVVVTHALGSCLGLAVHDPAARVGGLLHVMLPLSATNPEKAQVNPYMFVDTGVPAFFRELYARGAIKSRMVVKVAGGANVQGLAGDRFAIGQKNAVMLKKILWKNSVLIQGEDVGGSRARTLYLEIGSGRCWIHSEGTEKEL